MPNFLPFKRVALLTALVLSGLTACAQTPTTAPTAQAVNPTPTSAGVALAATATPPAGQVIDCVQALPLTPAATEGPYFTPNSPERASLLEDGLAGTPLVVTGYVFGSDCRPIAGALLDFWQADAAGVYDNAGYTLRGHQFTDANGQYTLTTVVPGIYPGRTEHLHVKVQAPNGPVLTTQLYFPGSTHNDNDGIFDPALLLMVNEAATGLDARFDFVVEK